jgi:hypothetical protein
MPLHTEISFETEICDHLAAHGWLYAEGDVAGYDGTALISAAVTGQIDVRASVASAPAKRVPSVSS